MFREYLILFFVSFLGLMVCGCGNTGREFDSIHKQFRSEYITNINNIKNTSYSISGYAMNDVSGLYDQISGSLYSGYLKIYKNGNGYIYTDCVSMGCGIFSILSYDFGDLFMYDDGIGGLNLKINKKILAKIISNNITSKNYFIDSISADEINWKGKYIDIEGMVNLKIEKLTIGGLSISGSIGSGLVILDISRGGSIIYIRNLSGNNLHIYSSGFMDIYITRTD